MSKASEFRQYADDAMRWARQSKSQADQKALIDIAHTWAQAAIQAETILFVNRNALEPVAK
jgi:hypothetical protein